MSQATQLGVQKHGACLRRCVTKRRAYEFPGGSTLDIFWLCRCLVICFCLKRMDCGQRPESPYVLKENVNVWYLISRSGAEVCKLKAAHKDLKQLQKKGTCSSAKYKPTNRLRTPQKRRADLCRFSRLWDGHTVRRHAATRYYIINSKFIGKRNRLNTCQDNDSPGQLNQMMQQVKIVIHNKKTKYGNEANMAQICVV